MSRYRLIFHVENALGPHYHEWELEIVNDSVLKSKNKDLAEGYLVPPSKGKKGKIRVAGCLPDPVFMLTLAHEFAHWRQYTEKDPIYFCDDYEALERATDAEALEILSNIGIDPAIMEEIRANSQDYLAELSSNG